MWYKILLYFMWSAGDDLESQQKGIVILIWPNPDITESIKIRYPVNQGGTLVKQVFRCVPMRVAAFHFCTPGNHPFFQVLKSVLVWTLSCGKKRSRLRFHAGEPLELSYEVRGYGMPIDLLPLTSTGNVKTTYLKQWMRLRNGLEKDVLIGEIYRSQGLFGDGGDASASAAHKRGAWIECPGSNDVVFKPGKPVRNHPGNVNFRSVIELWSVQHETTTQTRKSEIAKMVVDEMIHVRGGRFLTWDESKSDYHRTFPGCWRVIEDPYQQRRKVAIAFRNFKTYKRAMGNRQTILTSHSDAGIQQTASFPPDEITSFAFENLTSTYIGDRSECVKGCTKSCKR